MQLDEAARSMLGKLAAHLDSSQWTAAALEASVREFSEQNDLKLGKVAQPLRAALTGSTVSPPVFDVMAVIGKAEALARIREQAA